MNVGIDIIEIDDLKKRISKGSDFLSSILSDEEIEGANLESLAGKIAAKEAIIKTGFVNPSEWKRITIKYLKSGAPEIYDSLGDKIQKIKVSISHTKTLAIAVALYE